MVSSALLRCTKRTSKNMEPRAIKNSGLCNYTHKQNHGNIPSLKVKRPGHICPVFRIAVDESSYMPPILSVVSRVFIVAFLFQLPQYVGLIGARYQQYLLRSRVSVSTKTTTRPNTYYKILGFN